MGYEVDFLPVGNSNGDAICIRYGTDATGYTIHVVDGGYADTGQAVVDHIRQYYGAPGFVDHVVLSHADQDHASGLMTVMERCTVGALWMNRPWLYAAEIIDNFHANYTVQGLWKTIREAYPLLVELERIAISKGVPIYEVFAGTQIGAFTVLAPTRQRYLALIPELDRTPTSYADAKKTTGQILAEALRKAVKWVESWWAENLDENPPPVSASNETSLVQLGMIDGRTILLTADVGPVGLTEAANVAAHYGVLSPPNVVQIPHHGSRRNVTPTVLNRWLGPPVAEGTNRGTAFCSVGLNKPEYPRHRVKNAFLRRGYGVIATRDTWKSSYYQLPPKPGSVPVASEPFSYEYHE